MEFQKTNKKVKYIVVGEIVVEVGEESKINSILESLREVGEAEVVDVTIADESE